MYHSVFAIFALVFSALAAEPTGRTPGVPMAYEEISMAPPTYECSPSHNCLPIANRSDYYVAIEVPEWSSSSAWSNRVVGTGDTPVYDGIYLDRAPVPTGREVEIVDKGQKRLIPEVQGNFISAMPPCLTAAAPPRGYMTVNPRIHRITLVEHHISFMGDDSLVIEMWDANKGVLVRAPSRAFGVIQGKNIDPVTLFDALGNPVATGRPWTDTYVPGRCRT